MKKSIFSILLALFSTAGSLLYVPAAHAQVITTAAGTGIAGFNGDGIPANNAQLFNPFDVAIDARGNIYISDAVNNRIRKIDIASGIISTVAGNGSLFYNGENIPATSAGISPVGIAVDAFGNIYIADEINSRIRKVDPVTGLISTIAGTGLTNPNGSGLPADRININDPVGIAVDSSGNVYFTELSGHRVLKFNSATGIVSRIAGLDANGFFVGGYNGDGIPASTAKLYFPFDVELDANGNVYIADAVNFRIRKVDIASGLISTVVGNGAFGYNGENVLGTAAQLEVLRGLHIDTMGNIFFSDGHRVRKLNALTGLVSTAAGTGERGYNGDEIPAVTAQLNFPTGLATDASNSLYIADDENHRIRRIARACPVNNNLILAQQQCDGVMSIFFQRMDDPKTPFEKNTNAGGGLRIFPDKETPNDTVDRAKVKVIARTCFGPGVKIFFKSFDVDDPSSNSSPIDENGSKGDDNFGTPNAGTLINSKGNSGNIVFAETNDCGEAEVMFKVTMQPGDNFKVAASADEGFLRGITADGVNSLPTDSGMAVKAKATEMLTVWRRLHVEVDSMGPQPFPEVAGSDMDPERNFIRGNITEIQSFGDKSILILDPQPSDLGFDDESRNLSGRGQEEGNGRFENGTIIIGGDPDPIITTGLIGNGINFVEAEDLLLPFKLTKTTENPISGSIKGMNKNNKGNVEFKISESVQGKNYSGGKLTVAGQEFSVIQAQGLNVEVVGKGTLPFLLMDDDARGGSLAYPPAGEDQQEKTLFVLMQTSDDSSKNLYAPAYIKPVYDLDSAVSETKFIRNINIANVAFPIEDQNYQSAKDFWVVYLQGAFQGLPVERNRDRNGKIIRELGDGDPNKEGLIEAGVEKGIVGGHTLFNIRSTGKIRLGGSFVYLQSLFDARFNVPNTPQDCLPFSIVHETGHQWGLQHFDGAGIMGQCLKGAAKQFIDVHLKAIRTRLQPQGEYSQADIK